MLFLTVRSEVVKKIKKKMKNYISKRNNVKTLNPWFFTGFTDAEGCFSISLIRNNQRKVGG